MAENLQKLIRILNTDVDGNKSLVFALQAIKGVKHSFANAICTVLKLDKQIKSGELTEDTLTKIEEAITHPQKFQIPEWLYNRRKDPETGENLHLSGTEIKLIPENDIKLMKKFKLYKGIRHIYGQPVRGQRTRSNFRKNKGKAKLGVSKSRKTGKAG